MVTLVLVCGTGCERKEAPKAVNVRSDEMLRVLRPSRAFNGLPRETEQRHHEAVLIRNYANDHNIEIKFISVPADRLGSALFDGKGDLAIGCHLEEIDPAAALLFTRPVFNPLKQSHHLKDTEADRQSDVVWVVPESSGKLLSALNEFLLKEHPGILPVSRSDDLQKMKERGYIRVLTRNNPACYFIHRGELMGFEYELIQQFAKQHDLDVVMVVPPRWDNLKQWMVEGKGDVIAACLTVSDARKKSKELQFCHPYADFREIIVARESDAAITSVGDLAGRTIHARKLSSYWATMEELRKQSGVGFELKAVPSTMETREIMHRVESGEFDLTIADSGFLDIEINSGRKLRSALMIGPPRNYGWVVRKDHPQLKAAIDTFFEQKVRTSNFNYLYNKYFRMTSAVSQFQDEIKKLSQAIISPYDKLIKISANQYDFHWCLIASQMYQESRFDPKAKSWSGARGLMQLMPATAREMGLTDRTMLDPSKNIDAGVHYLQRQRKRVPDEVDAFNRLCFGLAAYNGGYGHLIDARNLAEQLGRNRNEWVGSVDHAYSLLSTPEYSEKAKYGYCRSEEITGYVRQIITRYLSYKADMERLTQTED